MKSINKYINDVTQVKKIFKEKNPTGSKSLLHCIIFLEISLHNNSPVSRCEINSCLCLTKDILDYALKCLEEKYKLIRKIHSQRGNAMIYLSKSGDAYKQELLEKNINLTETLAVLKASSFY